MSQLNLDGVAARNPKPRLWGRGAALVLAVMVVASLAVLAWKALNIKSRPARKLPVIDLVSITQQRQPVEDQPKPKPKVIKEPKIVAPKAISAPTEATTTEKPPVIEGPTTNAPGILGGGVVTNDGPAGPLSTGPASTGGDSAGVSRLAYMSYSRLLQRHIQDALTHDSTARRADYIVVVRVWLTPDGAIQKAELGDSSGDKDMDSALKSVLSALPAMHERPPANMPQPIRLRISNRLTG